MAEPSPESLHRRRRTAVVLAAGQGKRMRSAVPKVLHEVAGRPMLSWVLAAARQAGCDRIVVIVGHGAEAVRRAVAAPDVSFVLQEEQLGTGHAVLQAETVLAGDELLLVLSGDVPLVTSETLERLAQRAEAGWGALAVADLEAPGNLGRVLRGEGEHLDRIVEAADASVEELAVPTVNAGIYALPSPEIFSYLLRIGTDNAQGELYLTDAVGLAARERSITLVELPEPSEAWGVNDRRQLVEVHQRMLRRKVEALLDEGVTVLDPTSTVVEPGVRVERDSILHPDVSLLGETRLGEACVVYRGAVLRDSELGAGVVVEPYTLLEGARVADGCKVGPFARLRPGADLASGVRLGNFVEVKNSRLEEGVKAGHLAYLGDATIGAGTNIGAGVITCNYDGRSKHRTQIGEGAFIGSDTMLVAPVTVGAGATTGAGSVIHQDVPAGSLGVGRARQRNIEGWAQRRAAIASAASRGGDTKPSNDERG